MNCQQSAITFLNDEGEAVEVMKIAVKTFEDKEYINEEYESNFTGTKQVIKEYTHHKDLEDIIICRLSQSSQYCVSIKNILLLSYFGIC